MKKRVSHCHLRILAASTERGVEARINEKIADILSQCTYAVSPMRPYWKVEGWGEIEVDVQETCELAAIKSRLAAKWDGDVADRRWTEFFDDAVMFLWLAEDGS